MAKIITQETFDSVVKENIVEFSMTAAEARDETVQQFEAQGINLANIIKDLAINEETGTPLLTEALDALKKRVDDATDADAESHLLAQLDVVRTECDKSVPHRVLAATSGALPVLIALVSAQLDGQQSPPTDNGTLLKVLGTLSALINKQPDIFNPELLVMLMKCLETQSANTPVLCTALQVTSRACIMHEINRQNIMNADIMRFLRPLMASNDADVVRRMCTVFRCLILDDDVRVEFGKAHDHAKAIAVEVLADLTALMESESSLLDCEDCRYLYCDYVLLLFRQSSAAIKCCSPI